MQRPVSALAISLFVSIPFLAAWALQGFYGGSMRHSDGTLLAIFGLDAATLLMLVIVGALLTVLASQVMSTGAGRER
jgi:hypothetical protein